MLGKIFSFKRYYFSVFSIVLILVLLFKINSFDKFLLVIFSSLLILNFLQIIIDIRHLRKSDSYSKADVFKSIFMLCPDLIYKKDKNLVYTGCNPAMLGMLEFEDSKTIVGLSDYDIFPDETAQKIRSYSARVLKERKVVSYKMTKTFANGKTNCYESTIAPLIENNQISGVLGIMRDITKTEELNSKIVFKNALLNAMLNNMPFVVYLKDLDNKILAGNSFIEKVMSVKIKDLSGKNIKDTVLNMFDECCDDKTVFQDRTSVISKNNLIFDGANMWFSITKAPIFDVNNNIVGIIVIIKDITKDKNDEKQKETFFATLTHDLKTPTNAHILAMKLLMEETTGPLNKEQRELIEMTLESNQYMAQLISTIMQTYRQDNGDLKLRKEKFDIMKLLNTTCKEVSNLSLEKQQKFVQDIRLNNSCIVADPLQIKRVMINLISNAINYGFYGTDINIVLEENNSEFVFYVKNKSNFIPKEKLDTLFEKFHTTLSSKYNSQSTGLGLYLSKVIIEKHNGKIFAESSIDNTCIFGFRIPKIVYLEAEESQSANVV